MFLKWYSPKILFNYNQEVLLKKLGFQLNPLHSSEIPETQTNRILQSELKRNKPYCYANWYENFIKKILSYCC